MKPGGKTIKLEEVTRDMIRFEHTMFGCGNCLWNGAECVNGARFKAALSEGYPTCEGYNYWD